MQAEREAWMLDLFDFHWFGRSVLQDSALVLADDGVEGCPALEPSLRNCEPTHRHFLSDEIALATSSDSALLTHGTPNLSTVLSRKPRSGEEEKGEEEEEEEEEKEEQGGNFVQMSGAITEERRRRCGRGRRTRGAARRGGRSKSLSELEFEELKGFMDLGFTFSEAEADQRLLSVVPGLQRLGRRSDLEEAAGAATKDEEGEGGDGDLVVPRRPYLSEAWEVDGMEERSGRGHVYDHLLRSWRLPAAGEGVDMKEHLRCWAHAVAYAVR